MNWDYVAGFIDGEGSIIIKPPRVRLYISNTDKKALNRIEKFLKCGYTFEVKRKLKDNWKKQYGWTICDHNECLRILKNLRKKLIIKKEKCEEAIKYIENKRWIGNYITKEELKKFGDMPYRKIAKKLKISHYCVFRYLKKYKLR
ncbi:MAG: LAGLIDADG family homing endonuclease [Candidatus Nanoarchaeia archaeon]|nr:LAGLIDADG family homing endonuclease [Candidatus Nanoarchaeia archaeon]